MTSRTKPEATADRLAEEFIAILTEWLTPNQRAIVKARNVGSGTDVCATHDFCDANMAMDAAVRDLGISPWYEFPEGSPEQDAAMDLWNEAWNKAKAIMQDRW